MKLVIIESPFKGDTARNKRYLRSCIRDCLKRGESPYASHRMLTDALDDDIPEERALGIEAGLAWAHVRQPVFDSDPADGYILRYNLVCHAFYIDLGFSGGMQLAKERFDKVKPGALPTELFALRLPGIELNDRPSREAPRDPARRSAAELPGNGVKTPARTAMNRRGGRLLALRVKEPSGGCLSTAGARHEGEDAHALASCQREEHPLVSHGDEWLRRGKEGISARKSARSLTGSFHLRTTTHSLPWPERVGSRQPGRSSWYRSWRDTRAGSPKSLRVGGRGSREDRSWPNP